MKKINPLQFFLILVLLSLQISVFAQQKFSLQQAIDYALKNNVSKINAELDVEKSKKKIWETTAIGLPHIDGELDYTNFLDIPTTLVPAEFVGGKPGEFVAFKFGTPENATAKITATQLLFDGTYIVGLKASKVYAELFKKQLTASEIEVKMNVAKAYFVVLVAEDNLKILSKSVENLKKIHFETSELFKNGLVEEIDVDRLALALSNLETQLKNVERQSKLAEGLLKFQIGMDLKEKIILTDSIIAMYSNLPPEITAEIGFSNRIEYKLVQTQVSLAELNMKRYKMSYLPNLAAFYTHQQNAMRNEFNFFDSDKKWYPTTILGVTLKVPIFASFGKHSQVQQSKIELIQSQNKQKNLEQALTLEGERAKTNYVNAFSQFENQKKNLTLSEKIYNTTVIKYKEGVGSSLEVSQSESEFFKTQSSYINSLYELLVAKVELDKVMGNY